VYTQSRDCLVLERRLPHVFWQSVTGSLQAGESHAEAARRELAEETGFSDEGQLRCSGVSRQFTIDPRWRHRFAPGVTENVEYEYQYVLDGRREVSLDGVEHARCEWMPLAQAADRVWSWTNRQAIEHLAAIL
jgi:dATP pyrophosphohydrolase